jgi:hypothetical protein
MAGQLLLHSDRADLALLLPDELREAHAPNTALRDDAPAHGLAARTSKKRGRADNAAKRCVGAKAAKDGADELLAPLRSTGADSLWAGGFVDVGNAANEDAPGATLDLADDDDALLESAGFL